MSNPRIQPRLLRCTEGRVISASGTIIRAEIPMGRIGSTCFIDRGPAHSALTTQLVGFDGMLSTLIPLDTMEGVFPGCRVTTDNSEFGFELSLGGRDVLSCLGNQILPTRSTSRRISTHAFITPFRAERALAAQTGVHQPIRTGIRSVDFFTPIGLGQRMALVAPPGVGKSTLIQMIAKTKAFDRVVLALVGERRREAAECIEQYRAQHETKFTLVCATADESPMRRMLAPFTATAIAEHFQEQGENVLLLVDSLTRCARAMREVSLAAGEPPIRQGYTPSVFAELPKLLERSGNFRHGSITAIYSLLQDGPEELDPLCTEIKSLLDGHITLSQELFQQGVLPALDPLRSLSRCNESVLRSSDLRLQRELRIVISALFEELEQARFGGAPIDGLRRDEILSFLKQETDEIVSWEQVRTQAKALLTA